MRFIYENAAYREVIMKYRNNGSIGALLDEYQRALAELESVITNVSTENLTVIIDDETEDPDCKSIQSILTHVIKAGYCYVIEIRKSLGESIEFVELKKLDNVEMYKAELKEMFKYNEQLFFDYQSLSLEEFDCSKKIQVRWGQRYDIEQLLEHAIVHILRHRRQIERFILQLK